MIAKPGVYREAIGGDDRDLLLRNGEIERFEIQYSPFGIYELWDQLFGRGSTPQVRHVRDLVALGLIGGGMSDRAADDLITSLGPDQNMALRATAQRLLGVTFIPAMLKKKEVGSRKKKRPAQSNTIPPEKSETSVE